MPMRQSSPNKIEVNIKVPKFKDGLMIYKHESMDA